MGAHNFMKKWDKLNKEFASFFCQILTTFIDFTKWKTGCKFGQNEEKLSSTNFSDDSWYPK